MFDTVILKSCGRTVWRIRFSTFATYSFGNFDSGAGRRFQVDCELSGIRRGKESNADEWINARS